MECNCSPLHTTHIGRPVSVWVVRVNWHSHECQHPRFPSRTSHCDEMFIVIHSLKAHLKPKLMSIYNRPLVHNKQKTINLLLSQELTI